MAKPRLPQDKAETLGADVINPGRFKDRKKPRNVRPIGEPYLRMTDAQKEAWTEFVNDLPWLNSSHRVVLRAACIIVARMDEDPEIGVQQIQALSALLSKLGATPVDETKISHDGDRDEADPTDRFFARPH